MTGQAWAVRSGVLATEEGRFEVPLSAVSEDADGQPFVWAVDESAGTVSRRPVEVVELTNLGVFVLGLQRGELIATAGAAFLHEGQRVRPDLGGAGAAPQ
jgi:multidrug efflux pump subunit AcrA (membrane-fusion protein)